jgi:transcriptional regulator with XRE-family HTH domain
MKKIRKSAKVANPLGQYLKEKRIAVSMTQLDLARKLGYTSAQFVSNWERGLAKPPIAQLKVLSKLLKINRNELISILTDITRKNWEAKI